MGRVRRGGYVIDWWIGDHYPKHVHVYKDSKAVCKLEVPTLLVLEGRASRKILAIIEGLIDEGKI